MTTVTLWILMILSQGYRPAVRIDQFASADDCAAAIVSYATVDRFEHPVCVKMKVAR